jgi:hypothetical protein
MIPSAHRHTCVELRKEVPRSGTIRLELLADDDASLLTWLPHAWRVGHEAAGAVLLAFLMQFFMNSLCASPGAIF